MPARLEPFSKFYYRLEIRCCQVTEITWCQLVVKKLENGLFF